METKTYKTIDRTIREWPSGPWDAEPDKKQWTDEATGLPCLAVRNSIGGHFCDYVGVPPSHPYYEKEEDISVPAHGGVTFSGFCDPDATEEDGICHVPSPGEEAHVYWFGFDCHHMMQDLAPSDLHMERLYASVLPSLYSEHFPAPTYKTLMFVEEECRKLAAQLAAVTA